MNISDVIRIGLLLTVLVAATVPRTSSAQDSTTEQATRDNSVGEDPTAEQDREPRFKILSALSGNRTLGGKQFWSDHFVYHDWRIQQNYLSKHFRLLDDHNRRLAVGTFSHCRSEFERLRVERELKPLSDRVVFVLHGLGRSRQSMHGLTEFLREDGSWTVLNMSYASTRGTIAEHAECLAHAIVELGEVSEVHFVAHSMGNLVIRHYLGDVLRKAEASRNELSRVKSVVMLAPPNHGAALAERFESNPIFRTLWGNTGIEIATWESLAENLVAPPCDFGIIAGGTGDDQGRNPLIEGDDDFVVAVAETRLPGARDFLLVPALHGSIMDHPEVRNATKSFFLDGYFIANDQRQSIERVPNNEVDPE